MSSPEVQNGLDWTYRFGSHQNKNCFNRPCVRVRAPLSVKGKLKRRTLALMMVRERKDSKENQGRIIRELCNGSQERKDFQEGKRG